MGQFLDGSFAQRHSTHNSLILNLQLLSRALSLCGPAWAVLLGKR